MKDPLISVIVPIYMIDRYIGICIESIISQTYRNLEIILVDDGSKDRCSEICDLYAKKDPRVRVIHKPNGGLVSARKAGLQQSNGAYINYVDGDDWIGPGFIEGLYTVEVALAEHDFVRLLLPSGDIHICLEQAVQERSVIGSAVVCGQPYFHW